MPWFTEGLAWVGIPRLGRRFWKRSCGKNWSGDIGGEGAVTRMAAAFRLCRMCELVLLIEYKLTINRIETLEKSCFIKVDLREKGL